MFLIPIHLNQHVDRTPTEFHHLDRKSVVQGKRVDLGGRRINKKKKEKKTKKNNNKLRTTDGQRYIRTDESVRDSG